MPELAEIRGRLAKVALALGSAIAAGTLGYKLIEGWSLFDALYMTVITLGTVGYGEVHTLSSGGRVFTIFLILMGLGVTAYAFSQLTAILVEGGLSSAMRRKKMENRIRQLEEHFVLAGLGHTGRVILEEFEKTKRPLVIIERDPEAAAELEAEGRLVIHGDALHDEILAIGTRASFRTRRVSWAGFHCSSGRTPSMSTSKPPRSTTS
jgi:voltage-gated potassium channel